MATVTPMLWVPDVREAMGLYVRLGFEVVGTDESLQAAGEIGWCALQLEGAEVMLRGGGAPDSARNGYVTLSFDVRDVDGWFARMADLVEVVYPPRDQPYGRRDFEVRDPHGFRLLIGAERASPGAGPY